MPAESFWWDLTKQSFTSVDTDVKQPLSTQEWLRLLFRTEVLIHSSQVWCKTARFPELLESASLREWFVAQGWRHSPPSLPTRPHLPHPGNLELTLAEPSCDLFRASLCCLPCSFCCLECTWAITKDPTATGCFFSKSIYQCPQCCLHCSYRYIKKKKKKDAATCDMVKGLVLPVQAGLGLA